MFPPLSQSQLRGPLLLSRPIAAEEALQGEPMGCRGGRRRSTWSRTDPKTQKTQEKQGILGTEGKKERKKERKKENIFSLSFFLYKKSARKVNKKNVL